jgi:hypothetical protein
MIFIEPSGLSADHLIKKSPIRAKFHQYDYGGAIGLTIDLSSIKPNQIRTALESALY